jgi:hypothetical protein
LRGQAALLEREGGDITGGVDIIQASDAAVRIDRGEAILIVGQPRQSGAREQLERDHARSTKISPPPASTSALPRTNEGREEVRSQMPRARSIGSMARAAADRTAQVAPPRG